MMIFKDNNLADVDVDDDDDVDDDGDDDVDDGDDDAHMAHFQICLL